MKSPRCVFLLRMMLWHIRMHRLWRKESTHESSAISCGVCGRTVTVSTSTTVDTVAIGFWFSAR